MKQSLTPQEKSEKLSKFALGFSIVVFVINIMLIVLANLDKILPIPH